MYDWIAKAFTYNQILLLVWSIMPLVLMLLLLLLSLLLFGCVGFCNSGCT
jgi:hypothetical protein